MPPFRNYFSRKTGVTNGPETASDENARPASRNGTEKDASRPGLLGSKPTSALSIKGNKDEPNEYKLSGMLVAYNFARTRRTVSQLDADEVLAVVNDSGVYLPPSPPEKKSFWQRSPSSTTTSSRNRSVLSENEPFSISRESFDSYRRSFDISARSPIAQSDTVAPRQSLDSRPSRYPRSAVNGSGRFTRPQPTDEEGFEDVGLNDEVKPKKKGLFSRFTNDAPESPVSADGSRPNSSHHGFHIPGRKRGASGQGAELGSIDRPTTDGGDEGVIR